MRVAPFLDEVEAGHADLGLISEAVLIDEFAPEGGEEALAVRVVVRIAGGAHGRGAHQHACRASRRHGSSASPTSHIPRRARPLESGVVAAGGTTQCTAHRPARELGLVSLHDLESRPGIEPLSRAGHRRKALVGPRFFFGSPAQPRTAGSPGAHFGVPHVPPKSGRRNVSACFSQFLRIVCADGSNSLANSSSDRPACTGQGLFTLRLQMVILMHDNHGRAVSAD